MCLPYITFQNIIVGFKIYFIAVYSGVYLGDNFIFRYNLVRTSATLTRHPHIWSKIKGVSLEISIFEHSTFGGGPTALNHYSYRNA